MTYKSVRPKVVALFSAALLTVGIIGGGVAAPAANAADFVSCSSGQNRVSTSISNREYNNGGLCLVSGPYKAIYQSDGNFVLYKYNSTVLWQSGTNNRGANKIVLQGDSNLVIYGNNGAIWQSDSSWGKRWNGTTLRMQSDGNLVIYGEGDGTQTALWSTGTSGR